MEPVANLDARVEDYLDDKLQSTVDLETLDALISSVQIQQDQLQAQLQAAASELETARSSSTNRREQLDDRITDFQNLQRSIDLRVKDVASSDAPGRAIARLQQPLRKLHAIELAKNYLLLLQDVDTLRAQARSHLPGDPKAALGPYTKLHSLAAKLTELQGPADDAAVHLVTHVSTAVETLWTEMEQIMISELETILTSRNWPRVDPESEMDGEWIASVAKTLDLQLPKILHASSPVTLLPFDAMCAIFIAEFRYHFLSDKQTSSLQAVGTHCFPWFLSTVEKWSGFLRTNLTRVLVEKFRDTPVDQTPIYVDPVCALVTSLLPVMREKLQLAVAEAAQNPTLLSRFMEDLMAFDEDIRSRFYFDGGDPDGWAGLTTEILDEWFEKWFEAERKFAIDRFNTIMETPDARHIDYDYGAGKTKPTFGAIRVVDLLASVTSRYENVWRFKHKIRFLIGIQLDILDEYHDRLRGSLEAYQAITSTVGRTLHGVTAEQLAALEGTGAFESLCKVLGSSNHVIAALEGWGDTMFFIDLWDSLQAQARNKANKRLSGELSYDEVKGRTSAAVGSDEDDGRLFDEIIAAYTSRRQTAQQFLVAALADSHDKAFRNYSSRTQWMTIRDDDGSIPEPSSLAISPEIDEPLRVMSRNRDFLARALGTISFREVWHSAVEKLQDTLWSDILMRQRFTALGAAQFARDLDAILSLAGIEGVPGGTMASLREAVQLLNLPLEAENGGLGLKTATDRVFTDNVEGKKVLEELGIDALTPANARQILQRRVENAE